MLDRAPAPDFGRMTPRIAEVSPETARPLWSVMIPTYNCANYLAPALESILAQDPGREQMHIEVVDDSSFLDDPAAIVNQLGQGRVLFHKNHHNLGMFHNFNACLNRSRGHLIHILNGDDYVGPDFYRKMADTFQQSPECEAVFSRSFIVNSQGQITGTSNFCHSLAVAANDPREFLMGNPLRTPGVAVRRSFYERHGGFDTRFSHIGDWDMWVRAVVHGGARMLDEPLAYYREHDTSDTSRVARSAENLRDHLRLSAKWQVEGPGGFDPVAFERHTSRLAFLQALAGLALKDQQAFAANFRFWREHAAPSLYLLACLDALSAIGRAAARRIRQGVAAASASRPRT